jgi:orotate phosphoribosyltransferase
MTTSEQLLRLFEQSGAILTGHFLLSSGKHSDRYLEKFNLLRKPRETERVCQAFTDRYREQGIEIVAGPTTGGILLAFEVARQMECDAVYAERVSDGSLARVFRRGTVFKPGARVLLVDDILTTGGSIRETVVALEAAGTEIAGIGVLVDRSAGTVTFPPYELFPLLTLDVQAWDAADCPLCAQGIPLVKPGTTKQA